MTREEAIDFLLRFRKDRNGELREVVNMAIEALKREQPDEWCTDCKEYDTEKKCCPRFNRVIRGAMNREPSEDEPQDEFDGMIFSTDKYMAFIDKKEIHIMRKGACKVTMERIFNTEEDDK